MTPAESNEYAQSINAYNARVQAGVDAVLIRIARGALTIIGGTFLGLYAIGAVWGGS